MKSDEVEKFLIDVLEKYFDPKYFRYDVNATTFGDKVAVVTFQVYPATSCVDLHGVHLELCSRLMLHFDRVSILYV